MTHSHKIDHKIFGASKTKIGYISTAFTKLSENATHLHKIDNKIFNVSEIHDIYYRRRLFRIFDQDKPFALEIIYGEPDRQLIVVPQTKHHGNSVSIIPMNHKYYSFRYRSSIECREQISMIEYKRKMINKFLKTK